MSTSKGPTNIRFPDSAVEAVKRIAEREGVTTSAWIRREVEREVERRDRPTDARSRIDRALSAFSGWVLFARNAAPGSDWAMTLQDAYNDLLEVRAELIPQKSED